MEFDCKYAKPSGEIVSTTLVGQTLEEVRHHLQEQGLLPITVRQKGWSLSPGKRDRRIRIKTRKFHHLQSAVFSAHQGGPSHPSLPGSP